MAARRLVELIRDANTTRHENRPIHGETTAFKNNTAGGFGGNEAGKLRSRSRELGTNLFWAFRPRSFPIPGHRAMSRCVVTGVDWLLRVQGEMRDYDDTIAAYGRTIRGKPKNTIPARLRNQRKGFCHHGLTREKEGDYRGAVSNAGYSIQALGVLRDQKSRHRNRVDVMRGDGQYIRISRSRPDLICFIL